MIRSSPGSSAETRRLRLFFQGGFYSMFGLVLLLLLVSVSNPAARAADIASRTQTPSISSAPTLTPKPLLSPSATPTSNGRDTSPAPSARGFSGTAILLGLLSGVVGSLISAIASTWYLPKRQHEFWLRQQHIAMCMKAYEKLIEIVEEWEKEYYNKNRRTDPDFTRKQLSIAGDIHVLFGESEAHKKFIELDSFITDMDTFLGLEEGRRAALTASRVEPKPTEFFRVRDDAKTALLNYMGIKP
jgi:hypothetical protein